MEEWLDNLIDWWKAVWKKITWKEIKLIGAGLSWGAACIMLWQYFDSMSEWPFPAIAICCIFFIGIGYALFESAMET